MKDQRDRLKEIQAQLDVLLAEVRRLRVAIDSERGRRSHPFPFDSSVVEVDRLPAPAKPRRQPH